MTSLESKLVQILKERRLSIATMESCTGGNIINRITNIEGSSRVTRGGYVTYSNEQKIQVGVPANVIQEHGVYSLNTAIAMAKTVQHLMVSDIAIGVTGTLSNVDISNPDSVQGEVYYCILYGKTNMNTKKLNVPVMRRELQKAYISDAIFEDLEAILGKSLDEGR